MNMLSDIRNLNNFDEMGQIEVLNDCIKELKDDDINKVILQNKLNSIKNYTSTNYVKKEYKDIYKVNY